MNIVKMDLLTIKRGIIAHQVNCLGVMGAGIALQIKRAYPKMYSHYKNYCNQVSDKLGTIFLYNHSENLRVANLFAQENIRGPVDTDYAALEQCFDMLASYAQEEGLPVYLPYGIGCGLAGGDWKIVSKLIEKYLPNCTICQL